MAQIAAADGFRDGHTVARPSRRGPPAKARRGGAVPVRVARHEGAIIADAAPGCGRAGAATLKKGAISFISNIVIGVASTAPGLLARRDARPHRRRLGIGFQARRS